ncbi:outer membrane protein assembly factor BamB [Virgibacillus halotolerans]|uniref:PQQ-like beta-propeller repeat protein n=1 Tax=Virgibacillus halotolerans TaxID=1071053 RepID=UPI0019613A3C|nr:PQQ-like beta-propeller repeat protein [Virgibacillus halotolerans]MBM7601550.1 outer membrane protein assembly factor BamB [Virgibacillus halotolerans]
MKKVIILVLVAFFLLLFNACSSEYSNDGEGNNQPNESESNKDENNDTQTASTEKEAEKAGPFDPNGNIGDFLEGDYDPTAIHPIDTNWTRQSRFAGPQKPEVLWSLEIVEKYTGDPEKSIPVIGADGTIYIVTNMHDEEADGLYAIASDGELKWKSTNFHEELDMHAGDYQRPAPAITADGDIWVHLNNDLFALFDGDNGDLKDSFAWETNLGVPADPFVLGMGYSDIIADSEGTVYFRSWDEIYAVDSSGELKWNFRSGKASEFSNMVLAPDRTLYLFDNTGTVYAIGEE